MVKSFAALVAVAALALPLSFGNHWSNPTQDPIEPPIVRSDFAVAPGFTAELARPQDTGVSRMSPALPPAPVSFRPQFSAVHPSSRTSADPVVASRFGAAGESENPASGITSSVARPSWSPTGNPLSSGNLELGSADVPVLQEPPAHPPQENVSGFLPQSPASPFLQSPAADSHTAPQQTPAFHPQTPEIRQPNSAPSANRTPHSILETPRSPASEERGSGGQPFDPFPSQRQFFGPAAPPADSTLQDSAVQTAAWTQPTQEPAAPIQTSGEPAGIDSRFSRTNPPTGDTISSRTQLPGGSPPAGLDNRPRTSAPSNARQLVEALDQIAQGQQWPGMPLTLEEAIYQSSGRPAGQALQSAMVAAYWQVWRDYQLLVLSTQRLQHLLRLQQSGVFAGHSDFGQTVLNAETSRFTCEMSLKQSQASLRQFFPGLSDGEYHPIPVDLPVTGRYETHYGWYIDHGQTTPQLTELNSALPRIQEQLAQQAAAAIASRSSWELTLQAASQGQVSFEQLVTELDNASLHSSQLLETIRQYNATIGEYAMKLKPDLQQPHQIARMLVPARRRISSPVTEEATVAVRGGGAAQTADLRTGIPAGNFGDFPNRGQWMQNSPPAGSGMESGAVQSASTSNGGSPPASVPQASHQNSFQLPQSQPVSENQSPNQNLPAGQTYPYPVFDPNRPPANPAGGGGFQTPPSQPNPAPPTRQFGG